VAGLRHVAVMQLYLTTAEVQTQRVDFWQHRPRFEAAAVRVLANARAARCLRPAVAAGATGTLVTNRPAGTAEPAGKPA